MLVDSHCHLDFPDFEDDLDGVVKRAVDSGVGWILTICTHVTRFDRILRIAEAFDNIYCSVGIHPHEAASEPEVSADRLIRMADHSKVVGFGETGLDYHYHHSPREAQQRSFRVHIEAARTSGLPVIIHTREADADMRGILREEYAKGPFSGVFHCFSSGRELADDALGLGFYLSLSGIVTFKQADGLRETARHIPLDRLLVETDAPFLAPAPKRGKCNEPAFTAITAARVAEIKEIDVATFADATTTNFFRLFAKAKPVNMPGVDTCG